MACRIQQECLELANFFIEFLTDPGDIVLIRLQAAIQQTVSEKLGRKWIFIEVDERYGEQSIVRFEDPAIDGDFIVYRKKDSLRDKEDLIIKRKSQKSQTATSASSLSRPALLLPLLPAFRLCLPPLPRRDRRRLRPSGWLFLPSGPPAGAASALAGAGGAEPSGFAAAVRAASSAPPKTRPAPAAHAPGSLRCALPSRFNLLNSSASLILRLLVDALHLCARAAAQKQGYLLCLRSLQFRRQGSGFFSCPQEAGPQSPSASDRAKAAHYMAVGAYLLGRRVPHAASFPGLPYLPPEAGGRKATQPCRRSGRAACTPPVMRNPA